MQREERGTGFPSIDGELRQKTPVFYDTMKNDTRTKTCQYSLTAYNLPNGDDSK